ncbi:Sel1 domain-containing protein [Trypanosoma theileri]|uniref:Sel1 domain-containing protein n=1 Tax=Trypanosoma theileri TaxID=67003 RepID=A0A1X0NPV5_9TRYP|nr:Sel1 domain-containing protein [Trypanosoma theileri]ORC86631.1 Sel1 domain-containing protein [Trypanosoma theileri]
MTDSIAHTNIDSHVHTFPLHRARKPSCEVKTKQTHRLKFHSNLRVPSPPPVVVVAAAPASTTVSVATTSSRSELEDRLQYLLLIEDRLSPSVVEDDVRCVLAELRRRRRERKAVAPSKTHSSGNLGADRPHVTALVQACESANENAAIDILRSFYQTHYVPSSNEIGRSLVYTALAEALIKRKASDKDISQALSLLDDAVSEGHVGAMLQVGLCLRDGIGVPPDLVAALTWIERAADAGYAPAMFELGAMYEDGVVVGNDELSADWGEAVVWYQRAAEQGHTMAQLNLGKLLWKAAAAARDAISSVSEKGTISGLEKRSWEWLEQAASSGNEEAVRLLRRKR